MNFTCFQCHRQNIDPVTIDIFQSHWLCQECRELIELLVMEDMRRDALQSESEEEEST